MTRCQVLTQWVGPGGSEPLGTHPKLLDDYAVVKWWDTTSTPASNIVPSPNTVVVEAIMQDATFASMDADPNYLGHILWSQSPP
jgi:hypothetical protein